MANDSLLPKVYTPGDVASNSGEYIECDPSGRITIYPRIVVKDLKVGDTFSAEANNWIRYGRI